MKRLFDIVGSVLALGLLFPVLMVIGLLVRLVDGSPVLHREWRVGRGGLPFMICKFRTMTGRPKDGPGVATSRDPRITRLGLRLKRARLDELPQFYNVLRGDMSLVGPRPLTQRHLATLPESVARELVKMCPGLTSAVSIKFLAEDDVLADVSEPEATYVRVLLPEKIRQELSRSGPESVWSDVKTVLRTAKCLCSPRARKASAALVRKILADHVGDDFVWISN